MDKRFQTMIDEIKSKMSEKVEPLTANSKVLLIDGLNTYIRVFAAVPLLNDNGAHIGGIGGFLRSMGYAISISKPTRVIVVFDGRGGSLRRKKIYPEYKNKKNPKLRLNRKDIFTTEKEESDAMIHELIRVIKYLDSLPVTVIALDNVEADDVIAYITTRVLTESKIIIMSADKDFLQLVDGNRIEVYSPTKKKIYTPQLIKEEYGVPPTNLCLYRAILGRGDKSDNIGGVKGLGTKTILKKLPLLTEERKIELQELLKYSLSFINKPKSKDIIHQKIWDSKDIIERNIKLMQLDDVDISASTKSRILELVNAPIHPTIKVQLMKLVMEDKLWASIPNIEMWLKEHFMTIDYLAQLSAEKEKHE